MNKTKPFGGRDPEYDLDTIHFQCGCVEIRNGFKLLTTVELCKKHMNQMYDLDEKKED